MDQLNKARGLLQQALGLLSSDKHELSEVRQHMKLAITKLESAGQAASRRRHTNQTQHQKWWGDIVANTPLAPTSPQAAMKSLKDLNAMISAEQKTLDSLEQNVKAKVNRQPQSQPMGDGLLQD